jgi:hypothetical protein
LLGDLLVGEIDGRDVAKLLRDLRDTGLSEYSVKKALTMIRALLPSRALPEDRHALPDR